MAPGRKRRSVRSDDVQENTATSPPLSQTTPTVGVTRAELDAVVLGLNQQLNTQNAQLEAQNAQNTLILNKLNDLLEANRQPTNKEGNSADRAQGVRGNSSQRATSPVERPLPQDGGSGPQPTLRERLSRQNYERMADVFPAGPVDDEEYFSGMFRQIMKESMKKDEDEKEWGFAPSKTPFTERILKAEFPRKFVPPTIPAYKGTSDHNEFLYKYDWHMTGARASDEIKCRYFPVYLEGVALLWFTKLAVRSID